MPGLTSLRPGVALSSTFHGCGTSIMMVSYALLALWKHRIIVHF